MKQPLKNSRVSTADVRVKEKSVWLSMSDAAKSSARPLALIFLGSALVSGLPFTNIALAASFIAAFVAAAIGYATAVLFREDGVGYAVAITIFIIMII